LTKISIECQASVNEVSMECWLSIDRGQSRVSIKGMDRHLTTDAFSTHDLRSLHLVCTILNFKLTSFDSDWTLQILLPCVDRPKTLDSSVVFNTQSFEPNRTVFQSHSIHGLISIEFSNWPKMNFWFLNSWSFIKLVLKINNKFFKAWVTSV